MKKRISGIILAMVMSITLITSNISVAFAGQILNEVIDTTQVTNPEEIISVIIELEKKPVLDCSQAQELGAEAYLSSDAAAAAREKLLGRQMAVQKAILEKINAEALFSSHYTNTINGFSAIVKRGDIPKIKALKEVKSIYADESYKAPESKMEPKLMSSTDMIGATNVWNVKGYKGEGTVVAVIDTGVDVYHEYMVVDVDTEVELTKESIATVIANYELNASDLRTGLTSDDVYYNRKFPFCFDYADDDTDVAPRAGDSHGVQIAGVIAANGTVAKATKDNLHTTLEFNGVAPEAQIIGMKVFPDKGGEASTSAIIAAVEDATTIGADVINVSLGSPAGFTFLEGLDLKAYELEYSFAIARNARIIVTAPAGNEGNAGAESYLYQLSNGGYSYPSTSYTDSGTINSPASKNHATAVASINNSKKVLPYIQHADGNIHYTDFVDKEQMFVTAFNGQTLEYVNCGLGDTIDFVGKDLTGKLALIERGTLTFSNKVANAKKAGLGIFSELFK